MTSAQESIARGMKSRPDDISQSSKLMYFIGKYLQEEYHGVFYSKSQNLARELRKAYDDALKEYDVLIMPTMQKKAQKLPLESQTLQGT